VSVDAVTCGNKPDETSKSPANRDSSPLDFATLEHGNLTGANETMIRIHHAEPPDAQETNSPTSDYLGWRTKQFVKPLPPMVC
jgi:hypothetical protein